VNRIAPDTDLSSFTGKLVEQVCLGRHQLQIHFEDRLSIFIEGECSIGKTTNPLRSEDYISRGTEFARLLEQRVEGAEIVDDRTIKLQFSNGDALFVFDSNDQYESFQIQLPNQLVVV